MNQQSQSCSVPACQILFSTLVLKWLIAWAIIQVSPLKAVTDDSAMHGSLTDELKCRATPAPIGFNRSGLFICRRGVGDYFSKKNDL
jgi:hypothetical protein